MMKKTLTVLTLLLSIAGTACAEELGAKDAKASLPADLLAAPAAPSSTDAGKRQLFTVSSDELNPTESLDRISGKIDMGFASPSQTYQSSSPVGSAINPFGGQHDDSIK